MRGHLKRAPTDVAAIRMLAEVAGRLGRYTDAEHLLVRCLELAPSFRGARYNYAIVLHRQNKPGAALGAQQALRATDHVAGNDLVPRRRQTLGRSERVRDAAT